MRRDPSIIAPVLAGQNPWHESGQVPSELAHPVERVLTQGLWRRLLEERPSRFHLILGPRRVGKTTAMYQTARRLLAHGVAPRRIWWMRLDHPQLLEHPLGTLVEFAIGQSAASAQQPLILLLDELVYAEKWDLWLKTFRDDAWPVRIVATSSAAAALRNRTLESGAGRWEEHYLSPYTLQEALEFAGRPTAAAATDTLADSLDALTAAPNADPFLESLRRWLMLCGGFPEHLGLHVDQDSIPRFYHRVSNSLRTDAIERALYKDIQQTFQVDNPLMLERVLYLLAGQIGGIVSPTNLCKDLHGLSVPTFERYWSYLERSYLVFPVANYSARERGVQKRGRKVYFTDCAVRNAALQRAPEALEAPEELGPLLENLVASHLRVLALNSGHRLYHWRDAARRGDAEVDFVLDHPERPVALEVGSSAQHRRRGLIALRERDERFAGALWLCGPGMPLVKPADASDGIGMIPLDLALVAIGAQAGRALRQRFA